MPHGDVAGLEYGANLHGEGLAALVALISADPGGFAAHLGNTLYAAAMRANRTVGPNPSLYESVGGLFVVEVLI